MFEIEKIDTFNIIDLVDEETELESTLYIEGDRNVWLKDENNIELKNITVAYEHEQLFIDLTRPHKKSYKNQSEAIAASIYSHLASIKNLQYTINVYAEDEIIFVDRYLKGSGRSVQKFSFHPNDLLELAYSNLSKGKVFFIFKFTENCAIFMNCSKLEFIKGEKQLSKFGGFRFLENPLRRII